MKERKSILFILPLIALVLMSCQFASIDLGRTMLNGSGDLVTETHEFTNIERVTVEDRGDLRIVQGESEGLSVEADDNIMPHLRAEMRGNELRLYIAGTYMVTDDSTIRYTLRVKNLDSISIVGSGNMKADEFDADDLALYVTGSGNVDFTNLNANKLRVEISGSGNFNLDGKVESQSLKITGSGNYQAGDLESSEASLNIGGAGNATVWAKDKLDIQISGFGNVDYYGSPEISQTMAGGGRVSDLGQHK